MFVSRSDALSLARSFKAGNGIARRPSRRGQRRLTILVGLTPSAVDTVSEGLTFHDATTRNSGQGAGRIGWIYFGRSSTIFSLEVAAATVLGSEQCVNSSSSGM